METRRIRDTRFGRKPRNAVEALRQARDFLAQEGKDHWIKHNEFNATCDIDPNKPLCGNWGVCAIGALALVTGDLAVEVDEYYDGMREVRDVIVRIIGWSKVYSDAEALLNLAASDDDRFPKRNGYRAGSVVELNDAKSTKRADVIRAFDKAIALATEKANAQRGKRAAATKRSRKAVTA